jgi:hypothetical protein
MSFEECDSCDKVSCEDCPKLKMMDDAAVERAIEEMERRKHAYT